MTQRMAQREKRGTDRPRIEAWAVVGVCEGRRVTLQRYRSQNQANMALVRLRRLAGKLGGYSRIRVERDLSQEGYHGAERS